jgi:hypothetical protein
MLRSISTRMIGRLESSLSSTVRLTSAPARINALVIATSFFATAMSATVTPRNCAWMSAPARSSDGIVIGRATHSGNNPPSPRLLWSAPP